MNAARFLSLLFLSLFGSISADEPGAPFTAVACEGDYRHHLQGVCTDRVGAIYWCFTTELVKTDAGGHIITSVPVQDHHGDLCFADGKIYVAVNLGEFNVPEGKADSWVYVYEAATLKYLSKQAVPEVFHGAGGMDTREGRFFIVGGLPDGVEVNYVYEYDDAFHFVKRHTLASGWTKLGIQTAAWQDGAWWFGCYGDPQILLKTNEDFKQIGRYEYDCSLGIAGIAPGRFLVANGPRTPDRRHRGVLTLARPDAEAGLVRIEE